MCMENIRCKIFIETIFAKLNWRLLVLHNASSAFLVLPIFLVTFLVLEALQYFRFSLELSGNSCQRYHLEYHRDAF